MIPCTPGSEPALQVLGWPPAGSPADTQWRGLHAAHPGTRPARIVAQHRSGYVIAEETEDGVVAESPPQWQRPVRDPLTRAGVGDWVLLEGPRIVTLLPRYSAIMRAAASERYRPQMIAANVDVALIVCGLDHDFNPRRIERYLLLVQGQVHGQALTPVIVLTKADLAVADVDAARQALAGVITQEVAVVALNARDLASVAQLIPWLGTGRTAVLMGSSGAGKSTLVNTLCGQARMKTGTVRLRDARGRHTTTHRALIALPSGACLIDTPGMRALKPTGDETLAEGGFADIETLAGQCRFRDCRHQAEPGCAVRAAVVAGTLAPGRLSNYLKLGEEVTAVTRQRNRHRA